MKTYKTIQSVAKALELLTFLGKQKLPARPDYISSETDIPEGTVLTYLATMQEQGFVTRVGDGYEIGMAAAMIWARKKSSLESERDKIDRDLEQLESGGR